MEVLNLSTDPPELNDTVSVLLDITHSYKTMTKSTVKIIDIMNSIFSGGLRQALDMDKHC